MTTFVKQTTARVSQHGHHALRLVWLFACAPAVEVSPPPADAPAAVVAQAGATVMIGTGDIASCTSNGDEATARLVDSVLKADSAAGVENYVFTLGDNVYPSGSASDFERCWNPSWGDSTRRIMKWVRPSPGNHEHDTDWAAPYYRYFGARAGEPDKGYYSYDAGEWHVVVLNSVLAVSRRTPPADRTKQEEWLRRDLAENRKLCTLAYWHHARFSSGTHGNVSSMERIWRILHDAGVDLAFVGHDHHYERFMPQGPNGTLDTLRGITQIVVGTGGGTLRGLRRPYARNSAARVQGHFGVLKVTLGAGEFQHAFLDVSGRVWDRGGGKCH